MRYKYCNGKKISRCIDCELVVNEPHFNHWCIYAETDIEDMFTIPEWCPLEDWKE